MPSRRDHRVAQLDSRGFHRPDVRRHEALCPAAPPGAQPPPLWGCEDHVRALLGDRVANLTAQRKTVRVDKFTSPEDFRDYFKARYGPTIAAYRGIADDPQRTAALDRDLVGLASRHDSGSAAMTMEWEYLLITAGKNADHGSGSSSASHQLQPG